MRCSAKRQRRKDLLGSETTGGNIAMLPSKIADLAGLGLSIVTGWDLAANVWVDMGTSGRTITAGRYGHRMDVVY